MLQLIKMLLVMIVETSSPILRKLLTEWILALWSKVNEIELDEKNPNTK